MSRYRPLSVIERAVFQMQAYCLLAAWSFKPSESLMKSMILAEHGVEQIVQRAASQMKPELKVQACDRFSLHGELQKEWTTAIAGIECNPTCELPIMRRSHGHQNPQLAISCYGRLIGDSCWPQYSPYWNAFNLLATEKIAAIRIPLLLPVKAQKMAQAFSRLMEVIVSDDKNGGVTRRRRFGPNLYRFREDLDTYFVQTREAQTHFTEVFGDSDPVEKMRQSLNSIGIQTVIAQHQEKSLAAYTVREVQSASMHTDCIKREVPEVDFAPRVQKQFAWNLFLSTPAIGGTTTIWKDGESITIQPAPGELVIFDAGNPHEVTKTEEGRIALAGFLGLCEDEILLWA